MLNPQLPHLYKQPPEMIFQDRLKTEESFRVSGKSEFCETKSWLLHLSMKKYLCWL